MALQDKEQTLQAGLSGVQGGAGNGRTVWILNHYAEEPKTGTGLRHYNFAKYLQARGWNPVVVAASTVHKSHINLIEDDSPFVERDIDGIPFVFIRARNYWGNGKDRIVNMLDYCKGTKKAARSLLRPDVIMASSPHPLTWSLAMSFAKRFSCPWVCEIRDCWPYTLIQHGMLREDSPLARLMYAYERRACQEADAVVCTFPGARDYVHDHHPAIDVEKVFYINNGVDLEAFDFNGRAFSYEDADLADPDKLTLVYCGSVSPAYVLPLMADAMGALQTGDERERGSQLLVFGDGEDKAALEAQCAARGVRNVMFKGRVEKKYIPSILGQAYASCFSLDRVYVEKYGASPNKLFDYLAAGRPVLSNVPMDYDLVRDYACGVVAEEQAPGAIREALSRLVHLSEDEYRAMSENARKAASAYDFKVQTEKLEQILLRTMGVRS